MALGIAHVDKVVLGVDDDQREENQDFDDESPGVTSKGTPAVYAVEDIMKEGCFLESQDVFGILERIRATANAPNPGDRLIAILTAATIEFENDEQFKILSALESRRVRKDSNEVVISRGYRRFREGFDRTLLDMRAEGMIGPDLNLDAVRAAILGFAEGLWRDHIMGVIQHAAGRTPESVAIT
jgi:hypothetical protein